MVNAIFTISVVVTGFTEWLKNLLPAKVKESKFGIPIISGLISLIAAVAYVLLAKPVFGMAVDISVTNFIIYGFGVIGTVQLSYNVLLQTFKAIVNKLKEKYGSTCEVDVGASADKIVENLDEKITAAVKKALEEKK